MDARQEVTSRGTAAKQASRVLATLRTDAKNAALLAMADALMARQDEILAANAADLDASAEFDLTPAMRQRLALSPGKVAGMADGLREVAELPDPVGEVVDGWRRPNGLNLRRVRVPLGVIGIIYESRPNVTADAASLCLKSGNACLLRGGKEAIRSNSAIAGVLRDAAEASGVTPDAIQLVTNTSRDGALAMMQAEGQTAFLAKRKANWMPQ